MQYNNAPNYFIKNTRMYSPYFNNFVPNNLNNMNDNENKINNLNDLIAIKNKKIKNNYNSRFNKTIININDIEENQKEKEKKIIIFTKWILLLIQTMMMI